MPAAIAPMSQDELLALPPVVPFRDAARVLGLGTGKARELYRAGEFPCPVLAFGRRHVVTRAALFELVGISGQTGTRDQEAEHPADKTTPSPVPNSDQLSESGHPWPDSDTGYIVVAIPANSRKLLAMLPGLTQMARAD